MTDVPPQPGKMIPHFSLSTFQGTRVSIADFRGRKNLVLIFTPTRSLNLITELVDREEELTEEETVVLVIQPAGALSRPAPFQESRSIRVLVDADGQISRRFGAEQKPAVYITDQYGEIYSAHRASEGAALPDADEVLASLRHVNAACPE